MGAGRSQACPGRLILFMLIAAAAFIASLETAGADIFYTPAEYNRLYSDKVAVELELKLLKKQCTNEIGNLEEENRKLSSRVDMLNKRIELLEKQGSEDKKACRDRIQELEQRSEIMKMKSGDREKALLEDTKKLEDHYRGELEKLRTQLNGEREANLKKIQEITDACDGKISSLNAQVKALNDEISGLRKLTESQKAELNRMSNQALDMEKQLEEEIRKGDIKIKKFHDRLVININDKILFNSGSAALKPEIYSALNRIAGVLTSYPENRILVEGHTDNVPIRGGEFRDNWELSAQRALAVLQQLLKDKRLDPQRFAAVGYGEFNPIVPNTTAANKALNRRVDITVAPALNRQ